MINTQVRYWVCYTCFQRGVFNQSDKLSGKILVLSHMLFARRLNQRDKHPGKIPVLLHMISMRR